MCNPAIALAAVAAVASVANNVQQNKANKAYQKSLDKQNAVRQEEIRKQAGQELTERARAARRERGSARAAASAAGVNLDSNSFLAMLTTSEVAQTNDSGTILYNERAAQRARHAEYASMLSRIQYKTGLGIMFDAANAGAQAYFGAGGGMGGGGGGMGGGGGGK